MEQDAWQVFGYCLRLAWNPGLHDPDAWGIVLTLLYAAAAILVAAVALRGGFPGPDGRRGRWLWIGSAAALLLMALNKQLDLQSAITETGRCMARLQGWYEARRSVQRAAVIALIALAAALVAALPLVFRRTLGTSRLLLAGMVGLVVFALIRAISFHHMDRLLGATFGAVKLHRLIEVGALATVLLAAGLRLRRPPD